MIIDEQKGASFMSDVNKNLVGDTERTSILSRSGEQAAEQTEVLPTHVPQVETAQMPPITHQESANAFAGMPLESVAQSSADEQEGDEAVAPAAQVSEPASKKTSWGKRAAIAGAAAAILSVGFGAGIITHAAVVGDGQDFYEQGYEDGYNDQGDGDEDGDFGPGGQQQGNGQQQGPGNGQQGPGNGQQQGPGSQQGDAGSTRPGPPPEGGRGPGSFRGSRQDTTGENSDTSAS
jgi:hypothetical protein